MKTKIIQCYAILFLTHNIVACYSGQVFIYFFIIIIIKTLSAAYVDGPRNVVVIGLILVPVRYERIVRFFTNLVDTTMINYLRSVFTHIAVIVPRNIKFTLAMSKLSSWTAKLITVLDRASFNLCIGVFN